MTQRILHTALLLWLTTAPAFAESTPELPVDDRIKILTYTPADVYTLPTKYGYQTSVVFAAGEEIKTISVGDRSMWQIVPAGNRIFIRPMDDGLDTNMTVITNQREYNFDIKSVGKDKGGNLYVVQFRYPEPKAPQDSAMDTTGPMPLIAANVPAAPVAIPPLDTQRVGDINERYTYTGPDAIAPSQVYDDGKNTYVLYDRMPSPAPKPVVQGKSGKSAVARHEIVGNKIIIHTVSSGFVLKGNKGSITVYNEMFNS